MTRAAAQIGLESALLPNAGGYIAGRWCSAEDGATFAVHDPATGERLADVPAMGRAETLRAVEAGREAMLDAPGPDQRRAWLADIAQALIRHRDEIGRIICLEHGKPWKEGRAEADYASGFFSFCAEHVDELSPRVLADRARNCSWRIYHRPAGVVGLIVPWNFPIGMIAKKLSAALAAGCASVIKPSSKTPLTMIALFSLLERDVGLPPGWANLVMGPAGEISDALFSHAEVAVVSFTGSTEVGRELIRKSAAQVKRLSLELGGNAPFIIFADADLDQACEQLIANKFRGGGQTCVCANRVLVEASVLEPVLRRLATRVESLRLGNGLDPDTDLGPLVDGAGYHKVREHLLDALRRGAQLVSGTVPPPLERDWGGFFPPALISGVDRTMACWREETFGPLLPVAAFAGEPQALQLANDTEFGLAAYVFTADESRAQRMVSGLRFQHVGCNTGTGPAPGAPFGGMRQSGFGREGGREGLFEFVDVQTSPLGE